MTAAAQAKNVAQSDVAWTPLFGSAAVFRPFEDPQTFYNGVVSAAECRASLFEDAVAQV